MMIMILICESTPRTGLPPQSAAAVSRAQTGSSYRPASSSAVRFSRSCSGRLAPRMTLETCGFCRHQAMASGGGHDAAAFVQAGIPAGMIFVRNQNGSHNPHEAMRMDDFAAACAVVTRWAAEMAQ